MGTNTLKSNNIQFPIYNEDGTPFEGLVLRRATYDSVVMSLGDKITGEVVYKDNTLALTMHEYIEFKNDPDDEDEDPVRFSLVNPPTIIREGLVKDNSDLKGMTKYSFEFYHPMYQLSNMPFSDVAVSSDERKYLSENKTFGWIGKPKDYIDKLNKNLQGTEWVVVMSSRFPRDKADTLSEVLSFDNNTIADALKTAYDTWEVPYIVDTVRPNEYSYIDEHNVQRDYYDDGKRFVVVFGLPSNEIYASEADRQTGNKFVFKMGQGVGLKNNSRNPRNNKIITRIAGSGSENNIPYGYPQIVWYGNQNWDYTINNNPSDPHSYPIYKGIVGGRYVKLIKHPFTRKNLMPSVYSRSVFNKVSPYNPWSGNVPSYNQTLWQLKQRIQSQYSQESTAVEIEAYETLLEKLDVAAAKTSGSVDFSGTRFEGSIYNNGEGLLNGYLQINEDPIIEFEFESVLIESKFETNNPSYDPDATLIDYYDAVASQEYPYQNEINPLAPSYEFHNFEDIKPEMDDGQSNVKILGATPLNNDLTPADSWDDTIDNDGKFVQSYFSVDLPVLSFDIYACAAITQEMQINMRGGACIGCTFTIQVDWDDYKKNFYDAKGNFDPNIGEGHPRDAEKYPDSSTEAITVICQKETQTFGTLMPNRYKYPQANDEFVVLGISLPIEYIENAEARLDREMKSYMLENNVYYYDYPLKFDEYFLVNHKNILRQLKPNTIVRFEFAKEELQLFVKQLSIKYGESPLPQYNITLTDNIEVVLNQIGQVAEDVERLGSLISIMRQSYGNNVYAQIASKLSKRDDDTAAGLITFLKGILFGNSGLWGIDGQGIAHLNELYVDKLEATVAHFFELIIDKIKSVGGQIIVTAANAEITRVAEIYNSQSQLIGWKCYFPNTDGEKTIYNEFSKGDQVVCASFNQAREGHSQDISNKYYWRLCTDVGVEGNEHFIYLDATKGIASQYNGVPEVGDNIVQLGYNKEWSDAHSSEAASDKEQRKNAIIISAYNHNFLDAGVQAPSFVQYTGIEAFSLGAANRLNVISPSGNSFKGTFTVNSGENIEYILIRTIYKESSSRPSTPTYSEGSIPAGSGWSTTPPANATNQIWASVLQKNGSTYSWGTPVKWNGIDGTSVEIDTTRTYVRYSTVTNSPIQPSVSTFTLTAPPSLSQGDYLWSMSQTAYIGVSDVLRSFSVSKIGTDGTSIQITNTQITYKTSNSGTVTPTSGWSPNIPADYGTEGHEYLWTKTVVTYSDETSTTSYSVSHYGQNGAAGKDASQVRPNMLLRTVFEQGLDRVKEKWSADASSSSTPWNAITIDTASDTKYIEGRQSLRINSSTIQDNVSFVQNVLGKLKPNTTYTFSFYCFASRSFNFYINNVKNGVRTNIYENNKVIRDGQEFTVQDNGHNNVNFSNGWSQTYHTITFKTNADVSTGDLQLGFYMSYTSSESSEQVLVICMPKLEEGDSATAYMANDDDLQGVDSIVYKLTPQQESALVDKNKTLTLTLTYNLWKYIGDSATQISFSGFTVKYKEGSNGTETPLSISGNTASATATKQNYTNSPLFYTVILRYGGVEVDRRIVPVTTSANVVFEVGEDSIRSAVTQVSNIKNYFGFNRGILNSKVSGSEVCQLYPYGYGMACWGSLNRVYNLGLGTEDNNSTWTLYFEARSNSTSNLKVNVNFCDTNPNTINGESVQGQVTLNTSWRVFRCVWSSTISDVTRAGLNGYIDFEQSGTAQFYIRKICLVKGVKPMLEFVKADEDLTYSGGLQNFQWNIGATLDTTQKFMGMNVYWNPRTLNNSTVSFFDFFTKTIDIKNKTPYTLSFWAKANVDNVVIVSYLYESSWNLWRAFSELENMTAPDGACYTLLSTEWKHYTVHWFPNVEAITGTDASKKLVKNIIGCRLQKMNSPYGNNNATIYLAGVTYQEGWVDEGQSTVAFQTSEIKQTADQISSTVQNLQGTVNGHTSEISEIKQTSERIESTVKNMKVGGRNLILNGAFNYDSRYWSDWGSPSTREITTDSQKKKWMHIRSVANDWQGYSQFHFNDFGITIQGGKKYTISFRAKRNDANTQTTISVGFHWRNHNVNANIKQDWFDFVNIGTSGKDVYQSTFEVPATGTYNGTTYEIDCFNFMIGQKSSISWTQDFSITDIQLEEGTMATDWRESIEENHSLIEQTADNIKLEVESCGINISKKQITLDGNTQVNGNLNLNSSDQGFTVAGTSGTTQISPQSVGSVNDTTETITTTVSDSTTDAIIPLSNGKYQGTFTSQQTFGNVKSGSEIKIKTTSSSVSFMKTNSGDHITPESYTALYKIYVAGTVRSSGSRTKSDTGEKTITYNSAIEGALKIEVTVTAIFPSSIVPSSQSGAPSSIPTMRCSQYYVLTLPAGVVRTLIGYDGMRMSFGTTNSVFFGSNGALIKYGGYGLKVTDAGLQKWYNGAWVGLNTLNVVTVSSGTTLTGNEDFVLYNGSSGQRIKLPSASSYKGKVIYFKSIASSNVEIYGNIRKQTSDTASWKPIEIGKEAHFVISDGSAWNWFWCS